jgi:hypothetical protein
MTRKHGTPNFVSRALIALIAAVAGGIAPVALAEDYSVGVISADGTCPRGSESVSIYMDEEDRPLFGNYEGPMGWPVIDSYGTYTAGWTGAIDASHGGGTRLRWCKVDGTLFKPLSRTYDRNRHFAVLKLGSRCPPGSDEFGRYFDNEDGDNSDWFPTNDNSHQGNIGPNVVTWNTQMYFCLFRNGPVTMSKPPNLGAPYGLFARHARGPEKFPFALDSGYLHSDEEDVFNKNAFTAPPEIDADARRIIEPFQDGGTASSTFIHVVKASDGSGATCGSCGGTALPGGACDVATPPDLGKPCGPDGTGTVICGDICSVGPPVVRSAVVGVIIDFLLAQ